MPPPETPETTAIAENPHTLLAAVRRGDTSALGRLLELNQKRIFNTCLRMVSNRDDAAEVTQDTMLKVIEHIQDFNGQSEFSTWVTRIAMNLSISLLRRRKLRQAGSLDATGNHAANNDDQAAALKHELSDNRELSPDVTVQQREMIAHLHLALSRVEEDFRAVLVLRDIEEMDYQQIADVLAVPVGTVKSRLFRARLALRHEVLRVCPPPTKTNTAADATARTERT
ncbi:MAG: sigma-70 family RNA polymerase sigma factor [Phycisphaeraceae bacterium]|nr:sigma-70 family RNA polymerase sigma factor [Phycisphaeraceae bacterium]